MYISLTYTSAVAYFLKNEIRTRLHFRGTFTGTINVYCESNSMDEKLIAIECTTLKRYFFKINSSYLGKL